MTVAFVNIFILNNTLNNLKGHNMYLLQQTSVPLSVRGEPPRNCLYARVHRMNARISPAVKEEHILKST